MERIWQRSGILVEQALGRYGFAHRALQDYLAASHVEEHELDDLLLEHTAEERWREVVLIAIGLVPEKRAGRLLEAFLEREGDDASALEVAGLSLAEDVQVGDDVRAFGRLAEALIVADLESASTWMGEALGGGDPRLRERVLRLIPDLGQERAKPMAPVLLRLLAAEEEEPRVRVTAARAFTQLGLEPNAEDWEVLSRARRDKDFDVKAAATWAWCELGSSFWTVASDRSMKPS